MFSFSFIFTVCNEPFLILIVVTIIAMFCTFYVPSTPWTFLVALMVCSSLQACEGPTAYRMQVTHPRSPSSWWSWNSTQTQSLQSRGHSNIITQNGLSCSVLNHFIKASVCIIIQFVVERQFLQYLVLYFLYFQPFSRNVYCSGVEYPWKASQKACCQGHSKGEGTLPTCSVSLPPLH